MTLAATRRHRADAGVTRMAFPGRLLVLLVSLVACLALLPCHLALATTSSDGRWEYTSDGDGVLITAYNHKGDDAKVSVPSTIDGHEVTGIGNAAFAGDTELTSITLPSGITSMGASVFEDCINLESADLSDMEELPIIQTASFDGCTSLTSITIPTKVTVIGASAFHGCTSLRSVEFKSWYNPYDDASVHLVIGPHAFEGCSALDAIEIPAWTGKIETHAFSGCTSLCKVDFLGDDLSELASMAFSGCTSLEEVCLPDGDVYLGKQSFSGCTSLRFVGFTSMPTTMGADVFENCDNLGLIAIPEGTEPSDWRRLSIPSDASFLVIRMEEGVPYDTATVVKAIRAEERQQIDLPASIGIHPITTIEEFAFADDDGLQLVTFPGGCKIASIGRCAFQDCTALSSITIPASVASLGNGVFSGCSSLADISFETTQLEVIPHGAFSDCTALKGIRLPEGLTTIEMDAFFDCTSLQDMYLPDSLTTIEPRAIYCDGETMPVKTMRMPDSDSVMSICKIGDVESDTAFYGSWDMDNMTFLVTCGSWFEANWLAPRLDSSSGASTLPLTTRTYVPVDLADGSVSISGKKNPVYNAAPQGPSLTISRWWHDLSMPADYVFVYSGNNINAGATSVVLKGDGVRFKGELTIEYQIDQANLADWKDKLRADPPIGPFKWDYDDWEPTPSLVIEDFEGGSYPYSLKGADYRIEKYENNSGAGEATIKLVGEGNFTGSCDFPFTIAKRDLATEADVEEIKDQWYTGNEIKPIPAVSVPDRHGDPVELSEEYGDFSLSYENNVSVGTATVTMTALDDANVSGSKSVTFEIKPVNLGDVTIAAVEEQVFSGSAIEPKLDVRIDGQELLQGRAYTVTYEHNLDVGTAQATLVGVEPYCTGSRTVEFQIVPKDVTVAANDASKVFGTNDPQLTAVVEGLIGTDEVAYEISRESGEDAGSYAVTVTGEELQGNYRVSYENAALTIERAELETTVLAEPIPAQTYRAEALEPEVLLTRSDNGQKLVVGRDYEATYRDNVAAGTASVDMVGIGNYSGSLLVTFEIAKLDISGADVVVPYQRYTGAAIEALPSSVRVRADGQWADLTIGEDYTVSGWKDNIDVGTGSLVIEGVGSCHGTIGATFEIRSLHDLSYGEVRPIPDQTYCLRDICPDTVVTLEDALLVEGVDYIVEWSGNHDVGIATGRILGCGELQGELGITFRILPLDISDAELTYVGEPVRWWGGQPQRYYPKVTLGPHELVPGVHFECSFLDNTEVGTATVIVTGKDNCTGEARTTFEIAPCLARIKPDDAGKEYGTADPPLTASVESLFGTDTVAYDLVREEGESVGTYQVTSVGEEFQGNYQLICDDTATFTITPADLSAAVVTVEDQVFDGSPLEPEVTVTLHGVELLQDDYLVSYADNVNVGEACVTVTGTGNYTGSASGSFDVLPRVATVAPDDATKVYSTNDPQLTATVKGVVDDFPLRYDLARTPGEEVGDYQIAASGDELQGNYRVTFETSSFSITPADISSANVTVEDQVFVGSALAPEARVVLDGKTLEAGTDYSLSYEDNVDAGTAQVKVLGEGNYAGSAVATFTIHPRDISGSGCQVLTPIQKWEGVAVTPDPSVVSVELEDASVLYLELGKDYRIVGYRDNEGIGTGVVEIEGLGNYSGVNNGTFAIVNERDLSKAFVDLADQVYTGAELEPTAKVTFDGVDLLVRQGVDFIATYSDNVDVGTASVTLTGVGALTGSIDASFSILPADLSGAVVTAEDQTYRGVALEPPVTVSLGGVVLPSSDYEVSYSDNVSAGKAHIAVTGKGNCLGEATGSFVISQAPVTVTAENALKAYGEDDPQLTATVSGVVDDYRVRFGLSRVPGEDVGSYAITASGDEDQGNYSVSFFGGELTIGPASLSAATVEVPDQVFDGSAKEPDVTVRMGGKTLLCGKDFDVSFADNVDSGKATVTVTGKGNYTGIASGSFVIGPRDMSNVEVSGLSDQTYRATRHTPAVVVTDGDAVLVAGKDYAVSYGNNVDAGTAHVSIVGRGNYAGKVDASFQILPKAVTVTVDDTSKTYGEDDPGLTATVNGVIDDYLVTYEITREAGEDVGSYVIAAAGAARQGNYAVSFSDGILKISPASLDAAQVAVSDQVYAGVALTPEVLVTLAQAPLEEGTDYSVTFLNNVRAGVATVVVTGVGNYTGTARGQFVVSPAQLVATYIGESVGWGETPALEVRVTGFVGGESEATAGGYVRPTVKVPAVLTPGTAYELAPAGGEAHDYAFAYGAGTLRIGRRPVSADPRAVEGLVFDGSEQVGVASGEGFSVAGGSATAAGEYVASAVLDEGWTWTDGSVEERTIAWKIAPASVSGAVLDLIPDQLHTGSEITPVPRVTFGKNELVRGRDFSLAWSNNTEVGTATVTVTGVGNFEGTTSTTFEIVSPRYLLVSGGGATVRKGSGTSLTFVFERVDDETNTFGHFTGVEVDGRRLGPKAYEAVSGSVAVTLRAEYLDTLGDGSHLLRALFDDGFAEASFTVEEGRNRKPDPVIPKTGDASVQGGLLLTAVLSGAALIVAGAALPRATGTSSPRSRRPCGRAEAR